MLGFGCSCEFSVCEFQYEIVVSTRTTKTLKTVHKENISGEKRQNVAVFTKPL